MKSRAIQLLFFLLMSISANTYAIDNTRNIVTTSSINEDLKDNYTTHKVAKGETVYSIANLYNSSEQEIFNLNPKAKSGIKVGDTLKVPQKKRVASRYSNHLIEAKETMYSVSKLYNITEDELVEANPNLDKKTFKIGKTIRIPRFDNEREKGVNNNVIQYKVKNKETLYSISRSHKVSIDAIIANNPEIQNGGLKEDMILLIPQNTSDNQEDIAIQNILSPKSDAIKVGILFSFLDTNSTIANDKIAEYYQGFLLGVKKLKEQGYNIEIYTLDIGKETDPSKLQSILGTSEMNDLDLIIGGTSKNQIDIISRFAKKNNIKYAIPFDSRTSVSGNPNLIRMTTSPTSLSNEIASTFANQFRNYNIIFLSEPGSDNNKADIVSILKKELTANQIPFNTVNSSTKLLDDLKKSLKSDQQNMIVPTSSSEISVKRIITALQSISNSNISLFGYPEWQTYINYTNQFHKLDTYIYSIFYSDEDEQSVDNFTDQYKQWYNKNLINSYPKYAMLGYDNALYLLEAINKYGTNFGENAYQFTVPTLQSAIYLTRDDNNNGFINSGFYFIHFNKNGSSVEKTLYNK